MINTRLGHYDIVEELGRGGMGVVYKGYESSLGRYVAIKVLSASMAHDKVFVERFLREARAMATLNDAHIIQIYFIGQDEEQTFFVMEYIDGESLSTCLKREIRLVPGDALKILLHASQGLAAAHAQGVIHRDIKPGNIMITSRGQVKVADFGIALANHDASAKLTNTGAFVGTPGYLSPEVCLGKSVDQRSDIFALGICLFEMLSGRMPFQDDSPLKLMLDVVQSETPDIRELNPDVDEEIARILNKMLAKDPADRYQSCDELNNDLKKHPLVIQDGQLKVRPAPWAGANASNPTVVGMPTPATPGNVRASTPPPMVTSSRIPNVSNAAGRTPAPGGRITAEVAAPAADAAAGSHRSRNLLVGAGVVMFAVAGWLLWKRFATPTPEVPAVAAATATTATTAAPAAAATVAPPAVAAVEPAPTAVDAATGLPAAGPAGAVATALAGDAEGASTATVLYGHGGPNGKVNRVRVRAVREMSAAELLVREEARRQNELAVAAALGPQADAAHAAPAQAQAEPAEQTKRKGFLCRVFKKCDPPKAKDTRAAPAEAPAPAEPATPAAGT